MKPRLIMACLFVLTVTMAAAPANMPQFRWENFTTANGLPDNHVFCVLVDGDRVWVGTENGLGVYEGGKWKIFRPADGLAHRVVLSLALDKRTGDLWAGTMGGLSRISAGRIDTFSQLNSGLANDIVYGVGVQGDYLWAATAAGASRLNTRTSQWSIFNERNTPMYEIWTYAVSAGEDKVYYAVLGRRLARVRHRDGALEGLQRPGWRNRDGAVQRSRPDSRDHHFGQLCGPHRVGGYILRSKPLRRPQLAQLLAEGQRSAQ